jgi:hypothetical protein
MPEEDAVGLYTFADQKRTGYVLQQAAADKLAPMGCVYNDAQLWYPLHVLFSERR